MNELLAEKVQEESKEEFIARELNILSKTFSGKPIEADLLEKWIILLLEYHKETLEIAFEFAFSELELKTFNPKKFIELVLRAKEMRAFRNRKKQLLLEKPKLTGKYDEEIVDKVVKEYQEESAKIEEEYSFKSFRESKEISREDWNSMKEKAEGKFAESFKKKLEEIGEEEAFEVFLRLLPVKYFKTEAKKVENI